MKHLLTLLGSLTMIGGAGATVVACGNKTSAPQPNPSENLKNKIEEARILLENNKGRNAEAEKTFQEVIAKLETIANNPDASGEEITQALAELETAITTFSDAVKGVAFTELQTQIADAEKKLKDNGSAPETAKTEFQNAINTAKEVKEDATLEEINAASGTLKTASDKFQQAIDEAIRVKAYNDFQAQITAAEKKLSESKDAPEAAKTEFQNAINAAKDVKEDATLEEINTASGTLKTASDNFQKAIDQAAKDSAFTTLTTNISNARALLDSNKEKNKEAATTFENAIKKAEGVTKEATLEEINTAISDLQKATDAFNAAIKEK